MSAASERCLKYRRRILDISQQVAAAHVASAFSCVEIVDCIYNELMYTKLFVKPSDTFIMSKGHGCLAQYVVLENLGILTKQDLDLYCKSGGRLGAHPDYGVPGIEASTGSLGHGLSMAVGIAYAERYQKYNSHVYVLLSDGELMEGSTWEALMAASNLDLRNITVVIDNNNYQSMAKTSEVHPWVYKIEEKLEAFGWSSWGVDGHNSATLLEFLRPEMHNGRFALVAETTKGKGVSFMQDNPIWHYRSPSPEEYARAKQELAHELVSSQ